jgi:4-hydroxybenzoate polyprenyltransferase
VRHCGVTSGRALRGLVDACHPGPTAVVTLAVALLAAAAGRDRAGVALMAVATLTGQLSIGWCNDAYDAERDRAAGRLEKPTVRGDVTVPVLWRAAVLALALTVVTSYVAAGPAGGTAHVVAVASAWAYDLRLKTTALSWLPYVVSFGLVPAFVTYGLTPPSAPAWWLTLAAALLGAGAHLANAIPDVASDESVGAGGAVARIGVRRATWLTLACLVAALTLLVSHVGLVPWAGGLLVAAATAGAVAVGVRGRRRALFRYVMGLALPCVGLLVAAASSVTG